MNPDKRDELYNNLINSGKVTSAEIGSIDDFKEAINDEGSAREFYGNLINSGIFTTDEIGEADDFYESISDDFEGGAQAAVRQQSPEQVYVQAGGQQGREYVPSEQPQSAVAKRSGNTGQVPVASWRETSAMPEDVAQRFRRQEKEQPQAINPTGPEKFGQQMQQEQRMRDRLNVAGVPSPNYMQQDFTRRMENIRKGNQPFGENGEKRYNPATGNMQRVYYTQTGEETNNPLSQWEANHRGLRLEQALGKSFDMLDGATQIAWDNATKQSINKQNENASNIWREMPMPSVMGGNTGFSKAGEMALQNTVSHLKYHDLQKMADDAWNTLGVVKQQAIVDNIYNTLREHHYDDDASDEQLMAQAEAMARQENERRMFELAVANNAPKSATDYFFRKALQNNAINMLKDAAARNIAGTTGDWEARDVAEQAYDKESTGHMLAGLGGTITGFLVDPTVVVSGGVARGAVGGFTRLLGTRLGEAGVRKFAQTFGGKLALGSVGGGANFATFEGLGEGLQQLRWGGKVEQDEVTGRYKIDGYDLGEVAKKIGHGALMGSVTGTVTPLVGNVSDRIVGNLESIAGNLGKDAVNLIVGKTAEGTIFSVPEWISTWRKTNENIAAISNPDSEYYIADDFERAKKIEELKEQRAEDMMDVWKQNEAMMLGFGLQHAVKSAPGRIEELRRIDNARTMEERIHNRRDVLSRLKNMLNNRPDLALNKNEKAELERGGYTDLKELVSEFDRWNEEKSELEGARPDAIDARRMIGEGEESPLPYNRFLQLMNDGSISEAARAKMYYYITGKMLPMHTVMGASPIEEVRGAKGNVTGYNIKSFGANGVITSKTFSREREAKAEESMIMRQAELNTLDIGERYYDGRGLSSADLREWVGKQYGVNVDGAIRKEPERRSDKEKQAVKDYAERLYAGVEREQSYERGYEADEQGRKDTMLKLAMSNPSDQDHTEKQAAADGVKQRIDDDAEETVARMREEYDRMKYEADGTLRPATMKETAVDGTDKEVYIVEGEVVTAVDGAIDAERSGQTIVVYDPVEGKRKMVSPSDLAGLGEVTTADQFKANLEQVRQQYIQQQMDAATGRFNPEPGQQIAMPDGTQATVLATDGTDVTVQMADGTQQSMPIAEVQRIADELAMADYNERHPDSAAPEGTATGQPTEQPTEEPTENVVEGAPEEFLPYMKITIMDDDGKEKEATVLGRVRIERKQFVPDENGAIVEYMVDGEVRHDHTGPLANKVVSHVAEPAAVPGEAGMEQLDMETSPKGDAAEQTTEYQERAKVINDGQGGNDAQGNRINRDGTLYVEHVASVDDITDTDFEEPTRSIELPNVPKNVREAIGAGEKPIIIKRNIFNKNIITHPDISPSDSRQILKEALYSPNLHGQTQPKTRPNYWVVIKTANPNRVVVLEVANNKDNVEIVGWHYAGDRQMKTLENQAAREDGQLLILTSDEAAAGLSTLPTADFSGKDTNNSDTEQEKNAKDEKSGFSTSDIYDNLVAKYGEKASHKIDVTLADKQAEMDKAKKALDKAQKEYDDAPIGKEEKAEKKLAEAQKRYDASVADKAVWDAVRVERDKALLAEAEAEAERTKEQRAADAMRRAAIREQRRNTEQATAGRMPGERYNSTEKIVGNSVTRTIADKTKIRGHYVLVEAEGLTPSHDPQNGWKVSEGFPTTEDGKSVNDRVYENDKKAQEFTEYIAQQYDGQAISEIPVVSSEGIVYDGNGRTMAGQIAARNNTDAAYIEALVENSANFGFSEDQVRSMNHPRVVMQVDEDLPYTTTTFARFNKESKKKMSSTDKAVSIGKQMTESARDAMLELIDRYGTLDTFFASEKGAAEAVNMLLDGGFVTQQEVPELIEETGGGNYVLSAQGKSFITNTMLGTLFDEEAIRRLGNDNGLKRSLMRAIPQIAENRRLKEYALTDEINKSIELLYDARQSGMKFSVFIRQGNAFEGLVSERYEPMVVLMAEEMSSGVDNFRDVLTLYNRSAEDEAATGGDTLFGKRTREDVKKEVVEYYKTLNQKDYGQQDTESAAATGRPEIEETGNAVAGSQEGDGSKESIAGGERGESAAAGEPGTVNPTTAAIKSAEAEVNTNPTEGQKEAGNYKKGHVRVDGFDITIEQPKGSVRRGTDPSGKAWEQEMHNTYGYIRGTEGVDGDHIDVFMSDDPTSGGVYVVDQVDPQTGEFDEHKVMYGFPDIESARQAYLSNYEDGWQGLGSITPVSKEEFKKWIESSHRKTKPFSEYASVKTLGDVLLGENQAEEYKAPAKEEGEDVIAYAQRVADAHKAYEDKQRHRQEIDDATARVADAVVSGEREAIENASAELEKLTQTDDKVEGEKEHRAGYVVEKPTKEQKVMVRSLVDLINDMGIPAHLTVKEGQAVLDKYREMVRALRAYHGSGADFDAFDHSHMGEGEGAQSYGYGTYVTEVEGIGKMYAGNADGHVVYNGRKWSYYDGINESRALDFAVKATIAARGNKEKAVAIIEKNKASSMYPQFNQSLEEAKDLVNNGALEYVETHTPILYEMEIPDDNGSNYLEWDKPIGEENIGSLLVELEKHLLTNDDYYKEQYKGHENDLIANLESDFKSTDEGRFVYENLAGRLGSDKAASEFLHSMGYVGIKYPAEYMSGGRSDGAKNYVIFDEGDLTITEKIRFHKAESGEYKPEMKASVLDGQPMFFKGEDGEVLGFTLNGEIYIDPRYAKPETLVHEYTHLWAEALRKANPQAWERLKEEMRTVEGGRLWDYVKRKYPELEREDEIVEEVFAHYSGKRGGERLEADMREEMKKADGVFGKAQVANIFHKLRELLNRFWTMARDLFAGRVDGVEKLTAEDFADMSLGDLLNGYKPRGTARERTATEQSAKEARDREYLAAVERGDMETAQRMVDTEARRKGYISGADYRMSHRAPNREDGVSLADLSGNSIVPNDYWTHPQYYQYEPYDYQSFYQIRNAMNNAAEKKAAGKKAVGSITMYRAVPKSVKEDTFRNGDWISPSLTYAKQEGESIPGGYRIISMKCKSSNVWWDANDINEWGYDDGKDYAYQNTKNNRKLLDAVTYDDEGKVIPLSKRFDKRNADIRFQKGDNVAYMERVTELLLRLASGNEASAVQKMSAYRTIGGNLASLRKAMSLQKEFDKGTVQRVTDLATSLINHGMLDNMKASEVSRLLSAVKNSTGKENIKGGLNTVMDILIDSQLRRAEEMLHKLESVRGSKVDAKGVQVQGQLDIAGQRMVDTFKKARGWQKEAVEEKMANAEERMGSEDTVEAEESALEFAGLQLAHDYIEKIQAGEMAEEELYKAIRDEEKKVYTYTEEPMLDADGNPMLKKDGEPMKRTVRHTKPEFKAPMSEENKRIKQQVKEFVASTEEAIRHGKTERLQDYMELIGRLSGSIRESMANAKAWKEEQKERVREIQHNANSDMEGTPSNAHYEAKWKDKLANNSFVQFLLSPLGTFDQMLRLFGSKSANGEGYLWNRFMRGWVDARQQEIRGVRSKFAVLDSKAKEVFGDGVNSWGDLIRRAGKLPKMTVGFWDGGEMRDHVLTQGNLMYIYMVDKMSDGRMKLRHMGVTEEAVEAVTKILDPRLKELADWMQGEFLADTRKEYNETHKRMFGASMAEIEDYFPLKILANARNDNPETLDNPDMNEGISTKTGSIIKRTANTLDLDLLNADALNVILDHVSQMEHWNAYAEFNRDLNTLRTYKHFRNQVQNMTTVYGSGKELWKRFNDVCQMAAGTYRPPRAKLDTVATNMAKGVTAAKVSLKIFTALKQFLSMPAYIPDARPDLWVKNLATPWESWSWAMENLPIFEERWKSRMAGDPRLLKTEMDWKAWRNKVVQMASKIGMSPNAFVDALTVSIGAKTIYETRKARYIKEGYGEEKAEKRAMQDAEVLYNETQQSSEGAFLSTMQVDRSWLSVMFTVFRNSSMAYQRQLHDALRNLKRDLFKKGNREKSIEFMAKQMMREGIGEEQAMINARERYNRQIGKDVLRVATFGFIVELAWNLGGQLPYLLFGDDDDKKKKMMDNVWARSMFGWVEGLTGGDVFSMAGQMLVQGEGNPEYLKKEMPITSDAYNILSKVKGGKWGEVVNDVVNLAVQIGVGVNPQSITDTVLAIMDACGDDPELAHEATIAIMRILQVPQSQIKEMYFDEVGLSGDEVSNYTPAQLAERYARYQMKRGRMLSPWTWADEDALNKQEKKANESIKERVDAIGGSKVNKAYEQYEEQYKDYDDKLKKYRSSSEYKDASPIEKAQWLTEYYKEDPQGFAVYSSFKDMDAILDKMVKYYLASSTPQEAQACHKYIEEYKQAMVNVLGAESDEERASAREKRNDCVERFYTEVGNMQKTRTKEEKMWKEYYKQMQKTTNDEYEAAWNGNQ